MQAAVSRKGRGQSTVEFALIAWPFFLLLFATADYAQFYFYEHSLRYAVAVAGRYATPGSVLNTQSVAIAGLGTTNCPIRGVDSGTKWISRNESIRRTFSNYCAINLPLHQLKVYSWPGYNNATEASPNTGPGIAGDSVKLTVGYKLKLITPVARLLSPSGTYTITVSAIFVNEPSGNFVTYTNYYSGEYP